MRTAIRIERLSRDEPLQGQPVPEAQRRLRPAGVQEAVRVDEDGSGGVFPGGLQQFAGCRLGRTQPVIVQQEGNVALENRQAVAQGRQRLR
ncbi:MAG: hypothetical protein ABSH46_13710 [Bryobacteraceae bacterium]